MTPVYTGSILDAQTNAPPTEKEPKMTYTARDRSTGTMRTVDTAENMGLDGSDGQNWYTSCDDHGSIVSSETREQAMAAICADFCEGCQWMLSADGFTDYAADMAGRFYGQRVAVADLYVGIGNHVTIYTAQGRTERIVQGQDATRVEFAVYAADGTRTFEWLPKRWIREVNGQPITVTR